MIRVLKYPELVGEMAKRKVTNGAVAKLLRLHPNSIYYKFNEGSFSVEEATLIRDTFFPDMSIEKLFHSEEE